MTWMFHNHVQRCGISCISVIINYKHAKSTIGTHIEQRCILYLYFNEKFNLCLINLIYSQSSIMHVYCCQCWHTEHIQHDSHTKINHIFFHVLLLSANLPLPYATVLIHTIIMYLYQKTRIPGLLRTLFLHVRPRANHIFKLCDEKR